MKSLPLALAIVLLALIISLRGQPHSTPNIVLRSISPLEGYKMYLLEHSPSYRAFQTLKRIVSCESSWNPNALNGSSTGLFQINIRAHKEVTKAEMLDPFKNINFALLLYKKFGLAPWYASEKCWK